jgi:glycosyltransferase involved in cell wall biosynthesis
MRSRISVVMPTFNRASFIREALDSLACQTEAPMEVLVIDDCSTDNTAEEVGRCSARLQVGYHRLSQQQGASAARNLGVSMARGDVIVFLDSDDMLEPDHHARALDVLSSSAAVGLFCCDAKVIGVAGEELHGGKTWTEIQCSIKGMTISSGERSLKDIFFFSTCFPGLTIRKSLYLELGGLDQGLFPLDDYDLQLKAAARSGVYYAHRPLARYREHGGNESGAGRGVRVGQKKLACLCAARRAYPELARLGRQGLRRLGEARREMAIALLRDGRLSNGLTELALSLCEDPQGVGHLVQIAARKVTGPLRTAH